MKSRLATIELPDRRGGLMVVTIPKGWRRKHFGIVYHGNRFWVPSLEQWCRAVDARTCLYSMAEEFYCVIEKAPDTEY